MAHDALRAATAEDVSSSTRVVTPSPPATVHVTYNKSMQYVHRYFSFTFASLTSATFNTLEKTVRRTAHEEMCLVWLCLCALYDYVFVWLRCRSRHI
jgi:hypothetical protein